MSESESEAKILFSGRSLQSVRFRYSSTADEPFGLKCILNKDLVYFNFNPFLVYNNQLLEIRMIIQIRNTRGRRAKSGHMEDFAELSPFKVNALQYPHQ